MAKSDELLPCPFCGSAPKTIKYFREDVWRLEHNCEVIGPIMIDWKDSEARLIAIWNTRHRASEVIND